MCGNEGILEREIERRERRLGKDFDVEKEDAGKMISLFSKKNANFRKVFFVDWKTFSLTTYFSRPKHRKTRKKFSKIQTEH